MGVHGEGVHAANIGVRYVPYFQAIFPMSFRWTQIKVKPPTRTQLYAAAVVAVQLLQLLASAIDTVVQQLYSCYS